MEKYNLIHISPLTTINRVTFALYKHIHPQVLDTFKFNTQKFPMFASSSSSISLLHPSFLPTDIKSFKSKKAYCTRKIAATYTTRENRAPCSLAPEMASPASLYEVLGISTSANIHDIKAAYRKLARTCHPDVVAMNQKESSANEFMKIHSAYSTLSDPYKRAQYDREIYRHRKPLDYSSVTMSGYASYAQAGRKWETDQCW